MTFFIVATIITFITFLVSYLIDPRRLINGFLFNIFLLSSMVTITYIFLATQNRFLLLIVIFFIVLLSLTLIFGIYVLIIALFINSRIVMKRESKSISNLLTLFLAIALLCYVIILFIEPERFFSAEINVFFSGFSVILMYYLFNILNFLMISFIYQFNRPKLNQDFIIVLGSGLIGDKVPPLLASRINRAIEFYNKQANVTTPPKIIFSGGRGPDEEISEALAMQKYAIEKGIPPEDAILEDKSVNTLENMKFSKRIMDDLMPNKYNSIFVTNNFHLFRAGIYARRSGLKSQGIGSKTALYFLPNALIREYIAIMVMNKKRHIIIACLILVFSLILALIQYFYITPFL